MSKSKSYLKDDKLHTNTITFKQNSQQIKNFNKIATLQPYMTDIQKRQKLKSKLNKNNKNKLNQSSSRCFRIKDVSSTSLHKLTFDKIDIKDKLGKSKQTINTTGNIPIHNKIKPNKQLIVKDRRTRSNQSRAFQSSLSKTINSRQVQANGFTANTNMNTIKADGQTQKNQKTNFFNDYLLRHQAAINKEKPKFRKNLYQIAIPKQNSVSQTQINSLVDISLKKISYTDVNIQKVLNTQAKKPKQQTQPNNKTQLIRKNNFRRGKYQVALHSSVNQKPQNQDTEPLQSQRLYELNKKQSNLSINQQMDILAQNQMKKFYRQIRTKQIQKSLQKSTQKYFGNDSYNRRVKSKNQIQLYLSSMINPSLNKVSQSTHDKSINRNKSPLDIKNKGQFYEYNFDFQPEKIHLNQQNTNKINQIQNPSEQESMSNVNQQNFQKQRKNAEIQFFHKGHPQLDWSDDNCQVDDI